MQLRLKIKPHLGDYGSIVRIHKMSVVRHEYFKHNVRMKHPPPCWLRELHRYCQAHDTYHDVGVRSCHEAYLYDQESFVQIPTAWMQGLFKGAQDYEHQLSALAWEYQLRFDPYHPFMSHDVAGVGRITLIKGALLNGTSQVFLRLLDSGQYPDVELEFEDPHDLKAQFTHNFTRYPWLICGASGVGKTSLLFAELARYFSEKTVVFMDRFQEMPRSYPMWIFLKEQAQQANDKGQVKAQELLDLAFKLGASTLVFGEIRAAALATFFHGLYSGHNHVYGTFHANSHEALLARMEMMVPGSAALLRKSVACLFLAKPAAQRFVIKELYIPT